MSSSGARPTGNEFADDWDQLPGHDHHSLAAARQRSLYLCDLRIRALLLVVGDDALDPLLILPRRECRLLRHRRTSYPRSGNGRGSLNGSSQVLVLTPAPLAASASVQCFPTQREGSDHKDAVRFRVGHVDDLEIPFSRLDLAEGHAGTFGSGEVFTRTGQDCANLVLNDIIEVDVR